MHQEGNCEVSGVIRYILNKVDYKDEIEDGMLYNVKLDEDYEYAYKDYTKIIFDNMSKYIISLFEKNGLNYQKHYENMLIKGEKKYKGIYILKCENISMEQTILHLFKEKLEKLPIAQNLLICNNETSIEEMQSFFYRAILCDYNTLFIIEILESFSNFQHNKMYSYINKLLSYKLENTDNKKKSTREYLNSCIYFLYKNLENESSFLHELGKYKIQKLESFNKKNNINNEKENKMENLNMSSILNASNDSYNLSKNIKVFFSDVCGLGKSFKIKKLIKEINKRYYHFPLGGMLSKKVIYEKLLKLLKKIKKDAKIKKDNEDNKNNEKNKEYLEYNNVIVHLDLIESKEISLINEFLFAFLITKFYTNNEDIIYIPNNIKIYIEIPNSFENYFEKYEILNEFEKEHIKLGELPKLELEDNLIQIFKRLIGKKKNEEIEKFIKENIGIKEYSYHQVQTFIKLFISQFNIFDGKLSFVNSKNFNKCINYFTESSKYFTNGGFAKLIMNKKQEIKDKNDLCLDAYENDLNKKFNTSLIFIDQKTRNIKLELLPDINEDTKINNNLNKEVDIVYLIDATGSMGYEINAAKEHVIQIFNELKKKYKDYNFRFGSVFYRDKIDSQYDENEYFPLTDDMEDLKNKISTIKAYGGGDGPEDWVEGYKIALKDMKWRGGIKLIIHIADAGAHGEEFSINDRYPDQGLLLPPLIQECAKKNINIIGFKISKSPERSFDKITDIYNEYKLSDHNNGQFIEIYEFIRNNSKTVSENFHKLVIEAANQVVNPTHRFLQRLKQILYLENELENDKGNNKSLLSILNLNTDNYVITEDNYKKMLLLIYRIKANIPVIIMGETGCGKTTLITKLSQILNNGEKLVEIINIHPGITDEEICKRMKELNEKAKGQKYINEGKKKIKKELWVFFDEINTCLSLSLLTEIFMNRTFNGDKLEENIRLIGACNPYRKRKLTAEKCGLTREDDKEEELVYKVEQLPQSLLYYVFSFGKIKDEDEKKYIKSIVYKIFNKDEEVLHNLTTEAISECHIYLRKTFEDPSIVSLREISRFTKCVEFFNDYFLKKNKNNETKDKIDDETKKYYKIKSIICSIYICYYIRLINDEKRGGFDAELQKTLLKIVNFYSENKNNEENEINLLNKIKNEKLKKEVLERKNFEQFSDLLKIEEEFLLKQIELDKGIGKNELLKENLFLLFLAVVTKIPVIIIGKPGTGKSLSVQLIYNSMRGKYSKNKFFQKYPPIIQIYFQGSESTQPEDVTELFKKAEDLYENYIKLNLENKDNVPIYMILFDELGLAEKAPTNPLKVLHNKLEYDGKNEGVCFIGISNYSLDAAKINRALCLSVPNLEEKFMQLKSTSESIVESISEDISKDTSKMLIFNILSKSYQLYKQYLNLIKKLIVLKKYIKEKEELKGKDLKEIEGYPEFNKLLKKEKIKTEFHGNRDFYNLIKGVAIEGSRLNNISDENQIIPIIENYIERDFGGIRYKINIDFDIECNDIKEEMKILKEILKEKIPKSKQKKNEIKTEHEEDKIIKVTSVFLFKKIYNVACTIVDSSKDNIKGIIYEIKDDHMNKYDLNKCINDNINDNNSRYLLLAIKSSLAPLIDQIIRIQNPDKKDIDFINGSPFSDDNNNEYKVKKVSEIQNSASKQDKIVILQNLEPIQPYLYDLYNMNYKIIDEQKYVRIYLDNFSEVLTPVNDSFRIIILVDKKFINSVDIAFLNRLEKIKISFRDLLNTRQKELQKVILNEIRLKEEIEKEESKINYDLNQLLINCGEQEIGGLVYYYFLENQNENIIEAEIKEKIYSKISNILPQDIIINLPEENPIKKTYFSQQRYNNFNSYINELGGNKDNYKISIIYTFSSITNIIEGYDKTEQIMITEIRTEDKLKSDIDDIKSKNEIEEQNKHMILFNFEQYNSNTIQFISDYINNYCKDDDYKYIFIIHIHRSFKIEKKTKKEKAIYSIPNIYKNINQVFIDNLQGSNISLNDLLKKNIKDVMFNADTFRELDNEFKDILVNFVYEEMSEKNKNEITENSTMKNISTFRDEKFHKKIKINNNEEKYCNDITDYMEKEIDFKNNLIKKAKELIEIDKDAQGDCQSLVNKMFNKNHINKNSIDIISCILDYIKENIFKKYLQYIFKVLEHNNFLTTLMEVNNDKNIKLDKNDKSNKNILKELKTKFLSEIKVNDVKYEPKFLYNYKIPGFYNFYEDLSDYLTKNITVEFFDNEKKLRNYSGDKPQTVKDKFHKKEKELLNKVSEKICHDNLYFDLINKITPDLILKDYITFYLEKSIGTYSNGNWKIIELLLSLRFLEENETIKKNNYNPIDIIILKIIWIESNSNYIENILKVVEISKDIINDKDGIKLYQKIQDSIVDKDSPIKYIFDEERNPEFTREVNECFYVFLAGLCLSITEDIKLMEKTVKDYYDRLKEINNILQILNHDLDIYLNELFIIDELIVIIEYELDKGIENIQNIETIKNYFIDNSKIIRKNRPDKLSQLKNNFINLNNKLKQEKDEKFKNKYYDILKYIYMQEITKINEDNYCATILGELMKEKEIIKKSNDILQILLQSYIEKEDYKYTQEILLDNKDKYIIIQLIDKYLSDNTKDYYLALSETITYFFEKNSLIYLKYILKDESLGGEPLDIFKDCNEFLFKFKKNATKFHGKYVNITKLFCIGYIKSYCHTFIKMHDKSEFNPENIIKQINKCDEIKMIKLYIYKIIYNRSKKQIKVFLSDTTKSKYKLDKYEGFKDFIKFKNEENLIYENKISDNDNYQNIYKTLDEYQKDGFKNKITKNDINDGKFNFDDFYMVACNLILSKLKQKDFETDDIYINFYNNVCEPLYKKNDEEEDKLLILIQFLFEKEKYLEIKKNYEIKPEDIDILLYGYRYCLNEISEEYNDKEDYIYTSLYNHYKLDYLDNNFYPGSDTKEEESYYELYNKIENHFKEKPNQGCYVCLCDIGYYHSVPSGFPGYSEKNIKCPNCDKDIGAKEIYVEEKIETEIKIHKIYETIKREKYFRIFKDKEEIKELERYKDKYKKLKEINYMSIEEFKQKYIKPLYNKEKGLNKINENNFKKDNKKIRNLSQISYRLLNYILYSHLFFAKLFTDSEKFDNYLPKGMKWFNTIKECFILLQKELEKKGIKEIEIFMNLIFKDLFNKLHDKESINDYDELIKFENELEELIQKKFKEAKKEIDELKNFEKESIKDKTSGIALLKEIYNKNDYNLKDYPYYEHFYYTDYLDEEYINNMLEHMDKNEYPILSKYLEFKNQKKIKDKYSLDNLIIFNKVLKLFNDKYSNQITREYAETTIIKNSDIYQKSPENEKDLEDIKEPENKKDSKNKKKSKRKIEFDNKELIDQFIKLYNSFELVEEDRKMKLNVDKNCICDFLLVDDNKYGETYKKIYEKFIEKQNKELEDLLDKKINIGIFNNNCKNKISVQQIKDNEIFAFNIPKKKFNFIEVVCNSSYRKVIDTQNYENYNEYEISFDSIETKMSDLLLKNKKLLNNELIRFSYNNEVFSNEIKDLICNFKYGDMKISLGIDDKVVFYNYIIDNDGNNEKYKSIINDFITLIKYLNKIKDNNIINENTKISEIEIVKTKKNISKDFQDIFINNNDKDNNNKGNNDLIVNKIPNMFDYYLKIIFKYIKKDIEKYQEKKEDKNEGDKKKENDKKEKSKFYFDEITIKKLDEIFEKKDMIIKKESLATAIRLFISIVLYREKEKDKDKKIKLNRKNIIEYLKSKDIWEANIYNDGQFEENLEKIKSLNIKIKEILWFYYYLIDNKDEGFENEVKEHLKKIKDKEEKKRLEKERIEVEDEGKEEEEKLEQEEKIKEEEEEEKEEKEDEEEEEEEKDEKRKKKRRRRRRRKRRRRKDSYSDSESESESD